LEAQVGDVLFEEGVLLLELVDVVGGTEPGFPPCVLAEQGGELVLELPDAGCRALGPVLGVEEVGFQGRVAGGGACSRGRRLGLGCLDLFEQVAVPVEEGAVDGGGAGDAGDADFLPGGGCGADRRGDADAAH
jgi:hypothetical protein